MNTVEEIASTTIFCGGWDGAEGFVETTTSKEFIPGPFWLYATTQILYLVYGLKSLISCSVCFVMKNCSSEVESW